MTITPVALTGCPRSGTTALGQMLNRTPDVFCGDELSLFTLFEDPAFGGRFLEITDALPADGRFAAGYGPYADGQRTVFGLNHIDLQALRGAIGPNATGIDFLRVLFAHMGEPPTVICDKMPAVYLDNMADLAKNYPEMRFIIALRDGRAVLASQLRRHKADQMAERQSPHWAWPTIERAQYLWPQMIRSMLSGIKRIEPERVFFVRYEMAVMNPSGLQCALSEFLDVQIPTSALKDYMPINVGAFSSELPPDHMNRLSAEFKTYLRLFGYIA